MSSKESEKIKYLGIDAGGTFTDFVLLKESQWTIHKVLSTPQDPAQAILQGIRELGLEEQLQCLQIVHGSTVATNAVLERKEARTLYITNQGFKDVLTIGRQKRRELYNLCPKPIEPPVPETLCLEIDCRRDASGSVVTPLTDAAISALVEKAKELKPEAIAINLLFSYLNSEDEEAIEKALKPHYPISRSSFVLPTYKEYERGIATWLNASLAPKIRDYMHNLMQALKGSSISVMQSSGGTIAIEQAADRAANLLLSGPAGGLSAVRSIARICGFSRVISFDMGGTSTDVALMDQDFKLTDEGTIAGWPIAIPMVDMETIGAGGGSIAWVDDGGLLHVGPQSAGASPGPACYDQGGNMPTVTDANVVLGRLIADAFLGGSLQLNADKAIKAVSNLADRLALPVIEVAQGIVSVAEQEMANALRSISIQKGHDPQHFVLCCFGGAGGMHVCSLAEMLNMKTAIVPTHSGVLSAYGMLTAPKKRQLQMTFRGVWPRLDEQERDRAFQVLEERARKELESEGVAASQIQYDRELQMRFEGQSFNIAVPLCDDPESEFRQRHLKLYGHCLDRPIEVVNIALNAHAPATISSELPVIENISASSPPRRVRLPEITEDVRVFERHCLHYKQKIKGPAIITEKVSTTWLKPGWSLFVDEFGNLILKQEV